MMIYQVLNEENILYHEFSDLDQALQCAQDFTVWDYEHYYHVDEVELAFS